MRVFATFRPAELRRRTMDAVELEAAQVIDSEALHIETLPGTAVREIWGARGKHILGYLRRGEVDGTVVIEAWGPGEGKPRSEIAVPRVPMP